MSGRRLLDAARLANASRSIAKQHLQLRSQQLDVYSKTSTLAKAVKDQTDRVTLTAQAAIALARRFNEPPPTYSYSDAYPPPEPKPSYTEPNAQTIPSQDSVRGQPARKNDGLEGLEQDHHYQPSTENASPEPVPGDGLAVRQEQAQEKPLPDGTIPPAGTNLHDENSQNRMSPRAARDSQRQSEAQIPAVTTSGSGTPTSQNELSDGHDQDVFYERQSEPNTDHSSLPRAKIPKTSETRQGSATIDQSGINSDTFNRTGAVTDEQISTLNQEEVPVGVDVNVFRTARVSRMLGVEKDKGSTGDAAQNALRVSKPHPLHRQHVPPKADNAASAAEELGMDIANDAVATSAEDTPAPYQMRESRVPASRLGRLWEYSGLATSMAFGAVGESLRRVTGGSSGGSLVLSPANIERLVAKLSRMRGSALKLGQMLSFQDAKLLPKPIHDVLQRVQDSADYMPAAQRDQVLVANLGSGWRDLFSSFDEVPIAAASIGQVHKAVLASSGREVAVKVQYPGVANSIDSDLSNLSILLNASRLLPKGLYLDKTIANARTELAWECDYIREAKCGKRFRKLLSDETDTFTVPAIIDEASGAQVLTAELMHGVGVTKLKNMTQEQKDWIGRQILRLCLKEICEFRFMQTDPNWTNFLFHAPTQKIELLDFGASREYPLEFIEPYVGILKASSVGDRNTIRELSIKLGYLTGSESKAMNDAHIDSVLALSEPFRVDGPDVYDFRDQTITDRVRDLIPIMVRERLAPPPEETYSLHRKLSGAFLLCARLGSRVACKELFADAMKKFEKGR